MGWPFKALHRISIHPPRAGRDYMEWRDGLTCWNFNPPAPCGAGQLGAILACKHILFQSTRPVRGGTHRDTRSSGQDRFQSTRPVRGGTYGLSTHFFNPPAPCGAGPLPWPRQLLTGDFNPPAPCGAGRNVAALSVHGERISIHPPRAGRDVASAAVGSLSVDISIHPPRAGRDAPSG